MENNNRTLEEKEKELDLEEILRQQREYRLVLEALFTDEIDTKGAKTWSIVSTIGTGITFITLILWIILKK
jgi:hypothetical protein